MVRARTGGQMVLLGHEAPTIDETFAGLVRVELAEGAWYEHAPGWVSGHATLFELLLATMRWQTGQREMYDRVVEVPRLFASVPDDGPGHPLLTRIAEVLGRRHRERFVRTTMALYRDGRDSVAFHGDQVARTMPTSLMATVSLGAPRKFLLRPFGGGRSIALQLGLGDLLVMGGTIQRTWQHAIPKVAHADPRIVVMLRPAWKERRRVDVAEREGQPPWSGAKRPL